MELVNKVAQSGIISFDLEEYFPQEEIALFDLKDYLFRGMILREKDFRDALAQLNFSQYTNKYLAVFCSADAIIPNWAYMLVTVYAEPYAKKIFMGNGDEVLKRIYFEKLSELNIEEFKNQRIVIKGCSDKPVPVDAYLEITRILKPIAKSIMYGEPCSTVPVYKRKGND